MAEAVTLLSTFDLPVYEKWHFHSLQWARFTPCAEKHHFRGMGNFSQQLFRKSLCIQASQMADV